MVCLYTTQRNIDETNIRLAKISDVESIFLLIQPLCEHKLIDFKITEIKCIINLSH
jgi:hypothetical protein